MHANSSLFRTVAAALFLVASSGVASSQCSDWGKEFGPRGLSGTVYASIVWNDGTGAKLYVGGNFDANGDVALRGVGAWDGTSWSPVGGGVGGSVRAFAIFDDGSGEALYAAGYFSTAGGSPANNIARWDGSNWSPLGAGTGSYVQALTVFDDGSGPVLVAGGTFTSAGGAPASRVAKWNGSAWSAFGSGSSAEVKALAVFDGGSGPELYVGSDFVSPGVTLRKWTGSTWVAVGNPINGYVSSLLVHDDGSGPALYVAGAFVVVGPIVAERIARWDGSAWSAVGTGVGNTINALIEFDDGSGPALCAAGYFTDAGGSPARFVAKWDGSNWSAFGDGASSTVFTIAAYANGSGAELYAGGVASNNRGASGIGSFERWNGSTWSGTANGGEGLNETVWSLVSHDDGSGPSLFAGGAFSKAGGVTCNRIARWDGTHWYPLGSGMSGGNDSFSVEALAVFDDGGGPVLFAAGDFSTAGGVSANHLARWDGSAWSALGAGVDNYAESLAVFDDGSGPALYVGGAFQTAGAGLTARYIAKWDGSTWSSIGNLSARATSLVVFDDGSGAALYAGGYFSTAGGVPAAHVAKWNGSAWSALGSGTNSQVYALATHDDGGGEALYAGGNFSNAGGFVVNDIAKWNGSGWSALGSGIGGMSVGGTPPYVKALLAFDDGRGSALYVAGRFDLAGGASARSVAKWNGSGWSSLGEGITSYREIYNVGSALAVHDDGSGHGQQLYVGGSLSSVDGHPSYDIARYGPCEPGLGYCFGDGLDPLVTTDCPCGNFGGSGHGCANSWFAGGAQLTALGTTSPNTVVFTCQYVPNNTLCTFLRGAHNVASGFVFADGVRCANPPLLRFGQQNSGQNGNPPSTVAATTVADAPGTTRFYQCQYRNPAAGYCDPGLFNVSNGYKLVW